MREDDLMIPYRKKFKQNFDGQWVFGKQGRKKNNNFVNLASLLSGVEEGPDIPCR
jgi:hypothetical protein